MFDFDEIEEVVAAKGELGPIRKDEPAVAAKSQPKPPVDDDDDDDPFGGMCRPDPPKPSPTVEDEEDDPFGGMCRPDPPKSSPAVQDDDDDDPFGGMTRAAPPSTSTKVDHDDDDDDPFGGMCREEKRTAPSREGGNCVISVRYRHKSQRWTREYEIASGCTILDLKQKITAAEPQHACLFRLLRNSIPLRDEEKLTKNEQLDFLYDVPRKPNVQNIEEQELQITITLAAVFGIRTSMKVPKGLTVKALKELMLKQDPTNSTTLESFELIEDGSSRLLTSNEVVSGVCRHFTLCPCKGG
jgi:hypothetical protein|mmetsp:Transcript_50649/g.79197  ORF Transcript_50649/g.79197 Transcript_50649/m.79197 type:complete len:299 (-) Transcript_50649:116-1012(-)